MNLQQVSPETLFDSLSIGVKLYNYFDGFNRKEIQLFSYFSSILFTYTREPLSEWKYNYIIDNGYPFSGDLNTAIDLHLLNGNFVERENMMSLTIEGMKTYNEIKNLNSFINREKAISAACTTSIMIPVRETEEALLNDPELARSQTLSSNPDWINRDFVVERVKDISNKLGVPIDNILASSVSWVKYLSLINLENGDV
jgi:hypothetical protein